MHCNSIYKKYLCSIVIILSLAFIYSSRAEIRWAAGVLGYSSQLNAREFSAGQIVGKPSVTLDYGQTPCAWTPARIASEKEEWIHVLFDNPINIKQIAIFQNFNPGSISRVYLYDDKRNDHLIFLSKSKPRDAKKTGVVLRKYFEKSPYKVRSALIVLNTKFNTDWTQIDAVAVSDSREPIEVEINVAKESVQKLKAENLGANINSRYSELAPVISPDGRRIFFTRDGHPGNIGMLKKQDVWTSQFDAREKFSPAVNLGAPINNALNNFAISVTPDGNALMLGKVYSPDGKMRQGFSISYFDGKSWSFPDPQKVQNYYNLDSSSSASMSASGKALIISLSRNDTFGNHDLYVSFLNPDGTWSEPRNIGRDVNTAASEETPFLASDESALYFSTSGRPGYGENDMFISRRLDDTWLNWSEPENLGPSLNSAGWDGYYTVPASGEYAYFVSDKYSYGAEDIFRIKLPESVKPRSVALISGRTLNQKTGEPVKAKIVYETLPQGENAGIARSNPLSGEYKIVLPGGKKYGFLAEAEGFVAINENIDLRDASQYEEIDKDLFLAPIETGQTIRLNNIFFEFGSAELLEDSFSELNRVARFLRENPTVKIRVEGHTDNIGSSRNNLKLSKERAEAVAYRLVSSGIDENRLFVKGYGKSKPVADNTSEEGRARNRRVEFLIIEK